MSLQQNIISIIVLCNQPVRSNLPNKEPQSAQNPETYHSQEKDDLNIIKLLQDDGQLKSSTPIFLSDLISFQKFPDVSENLGRLSIS